QPLRCVKATRGLPSGSNMPSAVISSLAYSCARSAPPSSCSSRPGWSFALKSEGRLSSVPSTRRTRPAGSRAATFRASTTGARIGPANRVCIGHQDRSSGKAKLLPGHPVHREPEEGTLVFHQPVLDLSHHRVALVAGIVEEGDLGLPGPVVDAGASADAQGRDALPLQEKGGC